MRGFIYIKCQFLSDFLTILSVMRSSFEDGGTTYTIAITTTTTNCFTVQFGP
jgi:hypothetical protein